MDEKTAGRRRATPGKNRKSPAEGADNLSVKNPLPIKFLNPAHQTGQKGSPIINGKSHPAKSNIETDRGEII
jgi:hypothetical protein